MNAPSLDQIRADLAMRIRQDGLPVGAFWGKGSHLLVDEQGVVRSNQGTTAPLLESASLIRLAFLAERGVRGAELVAAMSAANLNPAPAALSDRDYETLVRDIGAAQSRGDYAAAWQVIVEHAARAAERGGLVGRVLSESCADSAAHYVIADVNGQQVRIRTLPYLDALVIPYWGPDAWVERSYVEQSLRMQDVIAQAQRSAPR